MTEENSPEDKPLHAERVGRKRQSRSLKVLHNTDETYPANLGELLDWHNHEVEDVIRAAQLRLRESGKVLEDYREGKIDFEQAQERVMAHDLKWGRIFPGGIERTRGQSDEEINSAMEQAKKESLERERRDREGRS